MADDVSGDVGTTPSPGPSVEQGVKDSALREMARSEDATAFIEERKSQEAEKAGQEINEDDRSARITKALSEAREATEQARQQSGLDQQPQNLDTAFEDAQRVWEQQQQEEQQFQAARELSRQEGVFQAHSTALRASNPEVWQATTDYLVSLESLGSPEQARALKLAMVHGNPQETLAALHRLSQPSYAADGSISMTPEAKMSHLLSLSPQELYQTIDQGREYLKIENDVARRYAAAFAQQGRRVSKAPPPIKPPRGGAAPPMNLDRMAAKSENISDYVKARKAQMKAAADER